jgi:hypothetical protein
MSISTPKARRNGLDLSKLGRSVEIVEIGPTEARRILDERNTYNRKGKVEKVRQYTRAMAEGKWAFNGDTIAFSKDGVLLNGQNRLQAVINSGTTQRFIVVPGVDHAAQETMDRGATRSVADDLTLRGFKNTPTLAATARLVLTYKMDGTFTPQRRSEVPPWEVVEYATTHHDSLTESISVASSARARLLRPSVTWLAAMHYLFKHVDHEEADMFMEALRDGDHLASTDVLYLLRRILTQPKGAKAPNMRLSVAVTIKAWNYWQEGHNPRVLAWRPGGSSPEPFPSINGLNGEDL